MKLRRRGASKALLSRVARAIVAAALALASTLSGAAAHADTPPERADTPPERAALAEALFVEGKELMRAGRLADACPKLAESHRLDPGGGVVLALALCHEAAGRTASAWSTFGEALTFAVRDADRNRETVARARLAALEPKLPRLTLVVAPATLATAGLSVRLDGVELARPAWGAAMPVDPGEHRIDVAAPGKRPRTLAAAVSPAATTTLVIDPLEEEPPSPPAPPSSPTAPIGGPLPGLASSPPPPSTSAAPRAGAPSSPLRPLGFAGLGLGAAAIAVGAGFLVTAISQSNAANARCPAVECDDHAAVAMSRQAVVAGDVATGAFVAGAVAAAAGAVLLLVAPPATAPAAAAQHRAWLAPSLGGISAGGSF